MQDTVDAKFEGPLAGRYVIRGEVGRGGMATVFLADDLRHGRTVAVKALFPELSGALGAERFLREIQVAAHLNHPHILPLLDSGQAEGFLWFAMPLVEGRSLREQIREVGQLPLEEALRVTKEVASGLSYAHACGLVHRDIKPENILLSSGHAVITDFGLARAIDEASDQRLTRTGQSSGTPVYMSPEQWSDMARIDARADQYSLACMLYEMLAGEPPFTGRTPMVLMARHSMAPVPSVRLARSNVPEAVDEAITRAMAKEPEDRFASVDEFMRALSSAASSGAAAQPAAATRWRLLRAPTAHRVGAGAFTAAVALVVGLSWPLMGRFAPEAEEARETRLVVLPFENLGPVEETYFADGVTEELTNRLAGIGSLGVIARTSAIRYGGGSRTVAEIRRELSVDYVIEGSVRTTRPDAERTRIRVTARLVRTSDGTQVWADEYDVQTADLFDVQSSIAEQVTGALDLVLLEPERRRLASRPTGNLEALDAYLRGNMAYERSWSPRDVGEALEMYERAVAADPTFGGAWAKVARTHAWTYQLRFDESEQRLVSAKQAVDRALALDPELPEAHIALGLYYYWGRDDYARAVDAFEAARRLQPSSAQAFLQVGNVRRRQGRFAEAIASYHRSAELDPASQRAWFNLAETLMFTRNYEEARPYFERVTELAPEFLEGYVQRARFAIAVDNDLDEARRILRLIEERIPPVSWGSTTLNFIRVLRHPDLDAYLDRVVPDAGFGLDGPAYHLFKARMLQQMGRQEQAVAQYDSARVMLERQRDEQPGSPWVHMRLGTAYAGLGRAEEAVRAGNRATDLLPVSRDALDGPPLIYDLAEIHSMLGDEDRAMELFREVLSIPSWASRNAILLDPTLSWIRRHPDLPTLQERTLPLRLAAIESHGP